MKTNTFTAVCCIEPLEARIAPAGIYSYIDVDGDTVTIKTSKGADQDLENIIVPFLSAEGVVGGQELQRIDFSQNPAAFEHTNLSVTAQRSPLGGDGLVNVGYIDAAGADGGGNLDLGNLTVRGDLGRILAGDSTTATAGMLSLTVGSMGLHGTDTQAGLNPSQDSFIMGAVGKLTVRGDIKGGSFIVSGGATAADGKLGALTIGGSLIGGEGVSGFISTTGALGPVSIGENIEGGAGNLSGQISAGGALGTVKIGGSVFGGKGESSGKLLGVTIGAVKITGDLRGGTGEKSGVIFATTRITSVAVGGSLVGHSRDSAVIESDGALGPVKIGGDVSGDSRDAAVIEGATVGTVNIRGSLVGMFQGAANIHSDGNLGLVTIGGDIRGVSTSTGIISAGGTLAGVTLGGSLVGGQALGGPGRIYSTGAMGPIKIGGDVVAIDFFGGGSASAAARIESASTIASITIAGSLIGGVDPDPTDMDFRGEDSGTIHSVGAIGSIRIGGDILGGSARGSGAITSDAKITMISVGGDVRGSFGNDSARIEADSFGSVRIGGSLVGGNDSNSGDGIFESSNSALIFSHGNIDGVTIGRDLVGGGGNASAQVYGQSIKSVAIGGSLTGGSGNFSGAIRADVGVGAVTIGGDLAGGRGVSAGRIEVRALTSLTIGGSVVGASNNETGAILVTEKLGAVKIGHDLRGGDSFADPVSDTGTIQAKSIGSLTVGGSIISGHKLGAGTLTRSGSVHAKDDLGAIVVKGSLAGNASYPVIITARGEAVPTATSDVAIKSLTVGGRVEFAGILTGYSKNFRGQNADAQIGAMKVGGEWLASYVIAGVNPGSDLKIGTPDDAKLHIGDDFGDGPVTDLAPISKIARIVIGGQVVGQAGTDVTYGFGAEQIGSFRSNGVTVSLKSGASNDKFAPAAIGDAHALGASRSGSGPDGFAVHVFEI